MSILYAILLGLLQGVTEFLPVSSSGHLAVAQYFFKIDSVPPLFDVILHIPSLLAVIIFFRKKIWALLCVLFRWIFGSKKQNIEEDVTSNVYSDENGRRTIIAIIITTFVTGVLGLVSSKVLPSLPIKAVFIGFIITAIVLILSGIVSKKKGNSAQNIQNEQFAPISTLQAIIIGIAQGFGTLPGISRSGATISGALFCGVDRAKAGEFSFIVSIPAILGAFLLELKDAPLVTETVGFLPLMLGCVASFIAAYVSLTWLMSLIKKGRLEWFACYLIPLGILGLIFA